MLSNLTERRKDTQNEETWQLQSLMSGVIESGCDEQRALIRRNQRGERLGENRSVSTYSNRIHKQEMLPDCII